MYVDIHTHNKAGNEGDIIAIKCLRLGVDSLSEITSDCSVGVHPWDIENVEFKESLDTLRSLKGRIIAIGEIGIDSSVKRGVISNQRRFYEAQLSLASEMSLPVIIHSVRQHSIIIDAINKIRASLKGVVIHGFIGSQLLVDDFLRVGCMLSFSMRSLNNIKNKSVIEDMPLGRMFLETDDSEGSIKDVYEKAAQIKGIDVAVLEKALYENYERIFRA